MHPDNAPQTPPNPQTHAQALPHTTPRARTLQKKLGRACMSASKTTITSSLGIASGRAASPG